MNNNEIFEEFWANYKWPEPVELIFRLYYDEAGRPIVYSTEDLPGKYIEVTQEQYSAGNYDILVRNSTIINKPKIIITNKLTPSNCGTLCHELDVSIVVDKTPGQYWNLKHYDNN